MLHNSCRFEQNSANGQGTPADSDSLCEAFLAISQASASTASTSLACFPGQSPSASRINTRRSSSPRTTALGKPAILIPYPYAAGNHQELNARKLLEMGAAKMMLDRELKGETLAENIRELYMNETMRIDMQRNSRAVGRPEACARVVDIAMSLMKQSAVKKGELKSV